MSLYEIIHRPELDEPVLVVVLEGWIDAGLGAANALSTILGSMETAPIATFDSDDLLDHRARRPVMRLVDGVTTDLDWPSIELRAGADRAGNDLLLLVGAEPDHRWRAFSEAAVDLAADLGARLAVGLGAYPVPVPHTRPSRLAVTAATAELAQAVGAVRATIDVPAGVQAAIEHQCTAVGVPAVGLWAQVPHYATAMPYPAASAALLDGLTTVADLTLGRGSLDQQAAAARERIDELINANPEHREMVRRLEAQYDAQESDADAFTAGNLPSGDELAAELERFLREQGG